MKKILALGAVLLTIACTKTVVKPETTPCDCPPVKTVEKTPTKDKTDKKPEELLPPYALLRPAGWEELDGLLEDDLAAAWPAWQQSCTRLHKKAAWKKVCDEAAKLQQPNHASIINYLTSHFDVFRAHQKDGETTGLVTGYYQPLLKGSRQASSTYAYPLYREPDDLITVELSDAYPQLKYKRVRGQLQGKKLVPYKTRAEIDANPSPLAGHELLWIDDEIDVFFLQIQGSGVVQLENGEQVQVGYANQNGHPYKSIGRLLVQQGELTLAQASMQGIKDWARSNPDKLQALLNSNPSYVFFRELPAGLPGPIGALGVPITAKRSIAVDRKFIPLGAPVFLSTTQPNSQQPLKQLMVAQDTGGAIKGGVRADFFWGAGDAAGKKAGAMKQQGTIWVLLPKNYPLHQH